MRRRLVCPVSESRRKAGQSKRRCRALWIRFQSNSEFKNSGRLADGSRERMGHAVVEFCRKSEPKGFFILFQNGTKLPRQSEKILPMVTFIFAKFAGAEPVVPRECQPKINCAAKFWKMTPMKNDRQKTNQKSSSMAKVGASS